MRCPLRCRSNGLRGILRAGTGPCLSLFVQHNTIGQVILLVSLLTIIGTAVDIADVALMVETDDAVRDITEAKPHLFSGKGAVAQSFGL